MGDLELGRPAVELPVRCVTPRRNRGRSLMGLSGLVLFVCLFLPAIDSCGSPVKPLEVLPSWPPYIYGGVFAVAALWRTASGLRFSLVLLQVVTMLALIGGLLVAVFVPPVGVVELVLGVLVLGVPGAWRSSESRVAATGVATAVICALWFGFWTITGGALIGVYLSLLSSIGLFTGSLQWLRALDWPPPIDMPRAAAIVRRRR